MRRTQVSACNIGPWVMLPDAAAPSQLSALQQHATIVTAGRGVAREICRLDWALRISILEPFNVELFVIHGQE